MKSQKAYSFFSKIYDTMVVHFFGYKIVADYFVRQLPFENNEQIEVLDAGCGTGLYSFAILKKFPNAKIIASDVNEEMILQMRKKIKRKNLFDHVKIFKASVDLPTPELGGKKFGLIVTGGVLEHVDLQKAVANLSPYLKPGGYFLNAGMRDNIIGKLLGVLWGFEPLPREAVVSAFLTNHLVLTKHVTLPKKYFLLNLTKETDIFKKL